MSIFDFLRGRPSRRNRQRLVFDNAGNIKLEDEETDFREDDDFEKDDDGDQFEENFKEIEERAEPVEEEVKIPEKKPMPPVMVEKPKPKPELPKFDPHTPIQVTGYDVTFVIPDDMRKLVVEIQDADGKYQNHYTLTNYLSMEPGQRLKIVVK